MGHFFFFNKGNDIMNWFGQDVLHPQYFSADVRV